MAAKKQQKPKVVYALCYGDGDMLECIDCIFATEQAALDHAEEEQFDGCDMKIVEVSAYRVVGKSAGTKIRNWE